ncbi:MAG: hypothetical protein Q7S96_03950 [bacterium]|nr:hypothetical protein [bacterium]
MAFRGPVSQSPQTLPKRSPRAQQALDRARQRLRRVQDRAAGSSRPLACTQRSIERLSSQDFDVYDDDELLDFLLDYEQAIRFVEAELNGVAVPMDMLPRTIVDMLGGDDSSNTTPAHDHHHARSFFYDPPVTHDGGSHHDHGSHGSHDGGGYDGGGGGDSGGGGDGGGD